MEKGSHPHKKVVKKTPPKAIQDPELAEMLKKIQDIQNKINGEIEAFCAKTGLSPKELDHIFTNSKYFTPENWAKMQKMKDELEGKLYKTLEAGFKIKKIQKEASQKDKERKGKTLAARKKNWIPMR